MNKTFIIAEAGANHNRQWKMALSLIDAAKTAGADAVKFQTYSSEKLYSSKTPDFANYKNITKLIKDIELPRHWQKDLKQYCDASDIEFMSTPFDEQAVDELSVLGVKRLKIAGFEASDIRLVKYVARTGLPIIFTAGIGMGIPQVRRTVHWILEENHNADITILHGNNAYPTPMRDAALGQIAKLQELEFAVPHSVGLSDHTLGILAPPVAVALGATTIEKHFTLNCNLAGPDHRFALEPAELLDMVSNIRSIEQAQGLKESTSTSELAFEPARRSVIISSGSKAGDSLSQANTTTKRPFLPNSVPASQYYNIHGKVINKDLAINSILTWDDLT